MKGSRPYGTTVHGLAVEEGAEAGVTGAADGEPRAIVEDGDVAILGVGLDAGDAFEIDDVGAMDAQEAGRIERGLEAGDGLLLEMLFAFGNEREVIVLRLGVVEFGNGNDEDAGAIADGNTVEVLRWRTRTRGEFGGLQRQVRRISGETLLGAVERGLKALDGDGFEEIVHGVDFEGANGVVVVRGDEDDRGSVADQFENFEAIELGHLNVEEDERGLALGDDLDGFEAVGALAEDFDFRMRGEEFAQNLAREVFVVHDDGADQRGGAHAEGASFSAGSESATRKRSPSALALKTLRVG